MCVEAVFITLRDADNQSNDQGIFLLDIPYIAAENPNMKARDAINLFQEKDDERTHGMLRIAFKLSSRSHSLHCRHNRVLF